MPQSYMTKQVSFFFYYLGKSDQRKNKVGYRRHTKCGNKSPVSTYVCACVYCMYVAFSLGAHRSVASVRVYMSTSRG